MMSTLSTMPRLPRVSWAFVFCCACGGGSSSDAGPSADCVAAEQHSDLTWIQANVFAKSCALSSCHGGSSPQGGLNLSSVELAESTLVMVPSQMCPTDPNGSAQYRVVPGDPNASWLLKMTGEIADTTPSSCAVDPNVGLMPMDNQLLCSQKLDAIQRWIAAGAPAQ